MLDEFSVHGVLSDYFKHKNQKSLSIPIKTVFRVIKFRVSTNKNIWQNFWDILGFSKKINWKIDFFWFFPWKCQIFSIFRGKLHISDCPRPPKDPLKIAFFWTFWISSERHLDFASNEPSMSLNERFFAKIWSKMWFWANMPKYGNSAPDPRKMTFLYFFDFF